MFFMLLPFFAQPEIYRECVHSLLTSFFEGYNATILAYGQTVRNEYSVPFLSPIIRLHRLSQ